MKYAAKFKADTIEEAIFNIVAGELLAMGVKSMPKLLKKNLKWEKNLFTQSSMDRHHRGGRHFNRTFSWSHLGGREKMGASCRSHGICRQHKHMGPDIGYPAHWKEIFVLRKLYVIPDKWCFEKQEKINKILQGHNSLAVFSDGSAEFEEVIKEWQLANKWLRVFAILMFCLLAMELVLWDQIERIRPMLQEHLRSIGL